MDEVLNGNSIALTSVGLATEPIRSVSVGYI